MMLFSCGRFTPQTATIIKLIPGDVGRPITDIVTTLDYPGLAKDTKEVLRKLASSKSKFPLVTTLVCRAHHAYRTQDNRIDGVVITFADITVAKNLEAALRRAQSDLETRFTHQTIELGKAKKMGLAKGKQTPPTKSDGTSRQALIRHERRRADGLRALRVSRSVLCYLMEEPGSQACRRDGRAILAHPAVRPVFWPRLPFTQSAGKEQNQTNQQDESKPTSPTSGPPK